MENPKRKLDKNAPDKAINPEQAIVNSAITQAAAMVEISECLNDIASELGVLRALACKMAVKQGMAPDEINDIMGDDAEE